MRSCSLKNSESSNEGSKKRKTHEERTQHLQDDLQAVINLMGPESPQFQAIEFNVREFTSTEENSVLLEVPIVNKENETVTENTPRDFSELSSFPTDTVDVYLESKDSMCPPSFIPSSTKRVCQCVTSKHSSRKDSKFKPLNRLNTVLSFLTKTKESKDPLDLYRINILQPKDDLSPPRRVVFDLVDELPKPEKHNQGTSTHHLNKQKVTCMHCNATNTRMGNLPYHNCTSNNIVVRHQVSENTARMQKHVQLGNNSKRSDPPDPKPGCCKVSDATRIDVYYFDHGNSAYYQTTDTSPLVVTEILAEKTERYTTKFWAELFGTVQIGFSFFTSFILQLTRFILQSFVRPLTVGMLQLLSDYLLKPSLATLFNAIIQPPLIFFYNICTSLRDICDPIAEGIGYFLRELAVLVRSCRFVDIKREIPCSTCMGETKCCNCKLQDTVTNIDFKNQVVNPDARGNPQKTDFLKSVFKSQGILMKESRDLHLVYIQ